MIDGGQETSDLTTGIVQAKQYSTLAGKSILKGILVSLHSADSVVNGWLSNNCFFFCFVFFSVRVIQCVTYDVTWTLDDLTWARI